MTVGVKTFMSSNPSSDARRSLCIPSVLSRESNLFSSYWNFFTRCPFMFCRSPLGRFAVYRRETWQTLLGKTGGNDFCICVKATGTIRESRDFVRSSARDTKSFNRSGLKIFEGWDPVFVQQRYRLCVIGGKYVIKWPLASDFASWYQSTSSDTSFNCAPSVLICITSRWDLKKRVRLSELNNSPKLALMRQVVFNVKCFQSTMSCCGSIFNIGFWNANFFTGFVRVQQVLCTDVFWRIDNFKV